MTADQEILYNTMTAILERLHSVEDAIQENAVLDSAIGVTLQEIADMKKISVSHLRNQPWLLPFENPEYGKKPYSYAMRQIVKHERLIEEKGIEEVKRMWQRRQKSRH